MTHADGMAIPAAFGGKLAAGERRSGVSSARLNVPQAMNHP